MARKTLNKFDYQFLTDTWEGVKGAAYNQTYEFCKEFGWCDLEGKPTVSGYEQIEKYELSMQEIPTNSEDVG